MKETQTFARNRRRRYLESLATPDEIHAAHTKMDPRLSYASRLQDTLRRQAAPLTLAQWQRQRWQEHEARLRSRPETWRAWCDGSARHEVRRAGIGGVLLDPCGRQRAVISRPVAYASSFTVECQALLAVLEAAADHKASVLLIYGDCQPAIYQLLGAGARAEDNPWAQKTIDLARQWRRTNLGFFWIPRTENRVADALSKKASRAPVRDTDDDRSADRETVGPTL